MKVSNTVRSMLDQIDRSRLTNNTQRVLFDLLNSKQEWVARTSIRVPSASARLRDLRKDEFGAFDVQCSSAADLNRPMKSTSTSQPTFYRLNPRTVTRGRVLKAFEGVITK